jgi:hypothetical protein
MPCGGKTISVPPVKKEEILNIPLLFEPRATWRARPTTVAHTDYDPASRF